MSPQPIPIIVNPVAGGGRPLRCRHELDATARACGYELEWWPTSEPGHGEELAGQAVRQGRPLVLACGGDGTYNEVARGLLGSSTAVGVIPAGTTSVMAYELEVPRPEPRALSSLLGGHDRAMRVGRSSRGDLVLLMLSAGPDALVLVSLLPSLKRLGGRVGVALQAVLELVRARSMPRLRAVSDGQDAAGGWAIVGNSRCYGGPHRATPGADPFAPGFELVLQRRVGRVAAVPFALGIPFERHVCRRDVLRAAVSRVSLEPGQASQTVAYQVDGDVAGELPVEIWVDEQSLMVRMPSQ